jgi:hypothetical protein
MRGLGGYSPYKPIFSSFRLGETWENGACEGTQAVLAMKVKKQTVTSQYYGM